MELSRELDAFSDLIGKRVENRAGRSLGRTYEVRARWEKGQIVLEELLIGRRGLVRRLLGPGPDVRGIPWEAIEDLGRDRIVVRA